MDKCKIRELWFQVNTLRRAALRPYFQEIGLTVGQGQPRILNSLRKYGTMTQRELADCCFVDVTTISRTVDRLVAAGLLSKQIDPECRRSCLISLTEEGRKKLCRYSISLKREMKSGGSRSTRRSWRGYTSIF